MLAHGMSQEHRRNNKKQRSVPLLCRPSRGLKAPSYVFRLRPLALAAVQSTSAWPRRHPRHPRRLHQRCTLLQLLPMLLRAAAGPPGPLGCPPPAEAAGEVACPSPRGAEGRAHPLAATRACGGAGGARTELGPPRGVVVRDPAADVRDSAEPARRGAREISAVAPRATRALRPSPLSSANISQAQTACGGFVRAPGGGPYFRPPQRAPVGRNAKGCALQGPHSIISTPAKPLAAACGSPDACKGWGAGG